MVAPCMLGPTGSRSLGWKVRPGSAAAKCAQCWPVPEATSRKRPLAVPSWSFSTARIGSLLLRCEGMVVAGVAKRARRQRDEAKRATLSSMWAQGVAQRQQVAAALRWLLRRRRQPPPRCALWLAHSPLRGSGCDLVSSLVTGRPFRAAGQAGCHDAPATRLGRRTGAAAAGRQMRAGAGASRGTPRDLARRCRQRRVQRARAHSREHCPQGPCGIRAGGSMKAVAVCAPPTPPPPLAAAATACNREH